MDHFQMESDFTVSVDPRIYSREVVLRASYHFTDRCNIWLHQDSEGEIIAQFALKDRHQDIGALRGEFANALIDFALRHEIEAKTQQIRSIIIGAALAEATAASHPNSAARHGASPEL